MADGKDKGATCPMIGILAVRNQLITKTELENGLRVIRGAQAPEEALTHYFLSNELISAQNIERLNRVAKALEIRKKEFTFGAIAIRRGYINQSLLTLALEEQENDIRNKRKPRLIGDMLVASGLMTQKQRDAILKLQKRLRPKSDANQTPAPPSPKKTSSDSSAETQPEIVEYSCSILKNAILLQVDGDRMAAYLTKTDFFDENVTVPEFKDALYEQGIVFGLMVDEMIEGFIRSSGYRSKPFRVAKGIPAIDGRDGKIEYFFNTDYLTAGGVDEDGNIDFRMRGQVPHVEAGTVLAEKIPMVPFRQGKNIFGEVVETAVGKDVYLKYGKGAVLSEDGLKVLAGVKGVPKFSLSGMVFVHQTYTTPGDVDYETGHIEYQGNVQVVGGIKSGFQVTANDIEAKSLDGGIVHADGDLVVTGGIVEGSIHVRGNVFARFIHKSEIVCMGNVVVSKEIVDSTIECSGACCVEYGKIISSTISAKMGVEAQHIGTEMASPCSIQVGLDIYARNELTKIRNRKLEAGVRLEELRTTHLSLVAERDGLQEKITQMAHIQDRAQLSLKDCQEDLRAREHKAASPADLSELNQRIDQLRAKVAHAEDGLEQLFDKNEATEKRISQGEQQIAFQEARMEDLGHEKHNLAQWSRKQQGNPDIRVKGTIQAGTIARGRHSNLVTDEVLRHSRIREVAPLTEAGDGEDRQYRMVISSY